jgi:hypothetical protein
MVLDSGYLGIVDVPWADVHKVLPRPSSVQPENAVQVNSWKRTRVVVEQFFGCMKSVMAFTAHIYPFDLVHLSVDTENCILLTNEHIRSRILDIEDQPFYLHWLSSIIQDEEGRKRKRSAQQRASNARRSNLLSFSTNL